MGYTKLFNILGDNQKLKSLITNVSSGYMELPYIINSTLSLLDDESPFLNLISDNNKKALCNMIDKYFLDCYGLYIEDMGLDKILKYGCIEVYKVEAANGLRYATTNEIAYGIKGLIGENIYPAGEKEYRMLCLLEWSFYGVSYYFRQAGYKLDYDNNGKVSTSFLQMIVMCANQLNEVFDWVSVEKNLESTLKRIKKMQKSHGYKYASYEKDEITEDITIKQLVNNIYKVFPRNSDNKDYRLALALAIKVVRDNARLSPLEVSKLRTIYDKYAFDIDRDRKNPSSVDEELKSKCEKLVAERFSGKINRKHFAYTIIETLKKNNYSKCSEKQLTIINDAYNIINKGAEVEEKKEVTQVISDNDIDMSLSSISDAIGSGLFSDDEDE